MLRQRWNFIEVTVYLGDKVCNKRITFCFRFLIRVVCKNGEFFTQSLVQAYFNTIELCSINIIGYKVDKIELYEILYAVIVWRDLYLRSCRKGSFPSTLNHNPILIFERKVSRIDPSVGRIVPVVLRQRWHSQSSSTTYIEKSIFLILVCYLEGWGKTVKG